MRETYYVNFCLVDWKEIDNTMEKVTHLRRLWIVKYVSGFSGVNSTRLKWREVSELGSTCYHRPGIKETTEHQIH